MSGWAGLRLCIAVCLLTLVMVSSGRADAPITLTDVRIGQHKTYTRLVLETAAKVPYTLEHKDGDEVAVVLGSALRGSNRPVPGAAGLIKKFAFDVGDDATRLTVLTTKRARVLRHFAIPGTKSRKPRIVIDLATEAGKRVAAAHTSRSAQPIQLPPMHTSDCR